MVKGKISMVKYFEALTSQINTKFKVLYNVLKVGDIHLSFLKYM